ncbi:MAG: hypothetical protein VZR34_06130, partial [Candidatus Cryptobacteroides sp.]|nr:hypothetical protein [Candidatus Cryptobacteroides sp.]
MKVKIYPAGVRVLALAVLTFFCAAALNAQDTTIKTKKQAEVMIPRLSTASVQTLNQSQEVMDTLDTASPFIKIILYSDYTWKYF